MGGREIVEADPTAADPAVAGPATPRTPWGRRLVRLVGDAGPVGRAFAAFLAYAAISGLVFVRDVFAHFGSWCVGWCRPDTSVYQWSFRWLPFALSHGLNPLFTTNYLWAPAGANLVWVTTLPGPSLVLTPVTAIWGPLASDNLIVWLAPALAGWACYLVCSQLTSRFWPAFTGGVVFGFSTYVGHHLVGHVNLLLMLFVPLAVYLVLRRVRGRIGPRAFVLLMALTLLGQFSTSTEIFLTMTLFGGAALVLALAFATDDVRRVLWATTGLVAITYLIVFVVVSPYVVEVFRNRPASSVRPLDANSADLLSYVMPRAPTWLGAETFLPTTEAFHGIEHDDSAYIGPALLIVIALFAWFDRRSRWTWFMLACVVLPVVLSFGPTVRLGGRALIPGPDAILAHLPVVSSALPDRFPLFAWLAVAVIVCLFLARAGARSAWRWILVGLGVVSLAVALPSPPYRIPLDVPAFFADGTYRQYLQPGETDLVLPVRLGDDMLWQQAAGFWFRQTRGYIGLPHRSDVGARMSASFVPEPADMVRYLQRRDVAGVILSAPAPPLWDELFSRLGVHGITICGVTLYRAPPGGWPAAVA
jgi:hypothetical protein